MLPAIGTFAGISRETSIVPRPAQALHPPSPDYGKALAATPDDSRLREAEYLKWMAAMHAVTKDFSPAELARWYPEVVVNRLYRPRAILLPDGTVFPRQGSLEGGEAVSANRICLPHRHPEYHMTDTGFILANPESPLARFMLREFFGQGAPTHGLHRRAGRKAR